MNMVNWPGGVEMGRQSASASLVNGIPPDPTAAIHLPELSTVLLDPSHGVVRRPSLPPDELTPTERATFDQTTLFYDLFRSPSGAQIIAIGPPAPDCVDLNRDLSVRSLTDGAILPHRWIDKRKQGRLVVDAPPETAVLRLQLGAQSWEVPVQPNLSDRLTGRSAITTISKDNPLPWLADWARFHAAGLGIDTVVLHDNNSGAYDARAAAEALARVPGLRDVVVVHQPRPFGPSRKDEGVHLPRFLQQAMLEHARWRVLGGTGTMLALNIDELLVVEQADALAKLRRQHPVISFPRESIATHPALTDGVLPRHQFFAHQRPSVPPLGRKWLAALSLLHQSSMCQVHHVLRAEAVACPSEVAWVAHFDAITTGWKNPGRLAPADPALLVPRPTLGHQFQTVFGPEPTAELIGEVAI